jgi:hypothetical protein
MNNNNKNINYNKSFIKSEKDYIKNQNSSEIVSLLKKALSRLNNNGIFLEKTIIQNIEKRLKNLEIVEKNLSSLAENMVNAYNYDKETKYMTGGKENRIFDLDKMVEFNKQHEIKYRHKKNKIFDGLVNVLSKLVELEETGEINRIYSILDDSNKNNSEKKNEPDKNEPNKNEPNKNEPNKNEPNKNEPNKNEPNKNEPDKNEPNKNKFINKMTTTAGVLSTFGILTTSYKDKKNILINNDIDLKNEEFFDDNYFEIQEKLEKLDKLKIQYKEAIEKILYSYEKYEEKYNEDYKKIYEDIINSIKVQNGGKSKFELFDCFFIIFRQKINKEYFRHKKYILNYYDNNSNFNNIEDIFSSFNKNIDLIMEEWQSINKDHISIKNMDDITETKEKIMKEWESIIKYIQHDKIDYKNNNILLLKENFILRINNIFNSHLLWSEEFKNIYNNWKKYKNDIYSKILKEKTNKLKESIIDFFKIKYEKIINKFEKEIRFKNKEEYDKIYNNITESIKKKIGGSRKYDGADENYKTFFLEIDDEFLKQIKKIEDYFDSLYNFENIDFENIENNNDLIKKIDIFVNEILNDFNKNILKIYNKHTQINTEIYKKNLDDIYFIIYEIFNELELFLNYIKNNIKEKYKQNVKDILCNEFILRIKYIFDSDDLWSEEFEKTKDKWNEFKNKIFLENRKIEKNIDEEYIDEEYNDINIKQKLKDLKYIIKFVHENGEEIFMSSVYKINEMFEKLIKYYKSKNSIIEKDKFLDEDIFILCNDIIDKFNNNDNINIFNSMFKEILRIYNENYEKNKEETSKKKIEEIRKKTEEDKIIKIQNDEIEKNRIIEHEQYIKRKKEEEDLKTYHQEKLNKGIARYKDKILNLNKLVEIIKKAKFDKDNDGLIKNSDNDLETKKFISYFNSFLNMIYDIFEYIEENYKIENIDKKIGLKLYNGVKNTESLYKEVLSCLYKNISFSENIKTENQKILDFDQEEEEKFNDFFLNFYFIYSEYRNNSKDFSLLGGKNNIKKYKIIKNIF